MVFFYWCIAVQYTLNINISPQNMLWSFAWQNCTSFTRQTFLGLGPRTVCKEPPNTLFCLWLALVFHRKHMKCVVILWHTVCGSRPPRMTNIWTVSLERTGGSACYVSLQLQEGAKSYWMSKQISILRVYFQWISKSSLWKYLQCFEIIDIVGIRDEDGRRDFPVLCMCVCLYFFCLWMCVSLFSLPLCVCETLCRGCSHIERSRGLFRLCQLAVM